MEVVLKNMCSAILILLHSVVCLDFLIPAENFEKRDAISLRSFASKEDGELRSVDFEREKHNEGIRKLLEDTYKFRNDNISTRFKIAKDYNGYSGKEVRTGGNLPFFYGNKATKVLVAPPIHWSDNAGNAGEDLELMRWSYAVRRIVGGMETSISMYPYTVGISRNGKHWCGGSIIDEQWVLTAGHCLEPAIDGDKKKLTPFIIRAGSSFHNRGGYQARVNKVFFPKEYTPGNADFDFSLLRLDRPMPIGRNIAVLNLPAKDYLVKNDDLLIVTGWGSTDMSGYGHIPERLRFVPVPVMKEEDCQDAYRFYITPRMLCAGYATGGKDACNHDSGGPAVRDGVLLGIVSFGGKHCGDPRSPGVYSRVTEVTEWVETTITKNEAHKVPELKAKIEKARQRERELQKFKARVEDKKNKIKNWLRETLKSPSFIKLAKKKLQEAGFYTRRVLFDVAESSLMDDKAMDEINLSNLITERLLGDYDENESEVLLTTMALQEVMMSEGATEQMIPVYGNREVNNHGLETVALIG